MNTPRSKDPPSWTRLSGTECPHFIKSFQLFNIRLPFGFLAAHANQPSSTELTDKLFSRGVWKNTDIGSAIQEVINIWNDQQMSHVCAGRTWPDWIPFDQLTISYRSPQR